MRARVLSPAFALLAACSAAPPASSTAPADLGLPVVPAGSSPAERPPAHTVGGFTIELPAMVVPPGKERFPCYVMPIEITGSSRLVGGALLRNPRGVHHGNVTSRPIGTGSLPGQPPCDSKGVGEAVDVEAGGSVLFGSSTQVDHDEWEHFPDGMAYRLPEGNEAVFRMHYLNATPDPITVQPRYEWFTIDEASLKQELAPFAWKYDEFIIPAKSDFSVRSECDFKAAMHVVSVLPHMHRMGRAFTAGFVGGPLDGKPWLESRGYDPERGVMQVFDPSLDLSQGQGTGYGVRWGCDWHNDLDVDVHEGVGNNEMCVLFGYAWPPGASYTVLSGDGWCQILSSGDPRP